MNIEKLFDFLKKDYNLSYKYQEFFNCYGGSWTVQAHSFYNDSGCFTIYIEIQRGMDFWCASRFSTERKELCERGVDVSSIEPQIWYKYERICGFKNPFFWWNDNKVLSTLAEALKVHLAKNNEFFGIRVYRKTGKTGEGKTGKDRGRFCVLTKKGICSIVFLGDKKCQDKLEEKARVEYTT